MKQWAPLAYPDGSGKHRNANPGLNQRGSWLDGLGYQQIIDELVAPVSESGQTPADTDSKQLLRAIRGGLLTTFVDTSGAANTLTIAPPTAHTAIFKGLPFTIWPANTNTSTTVNLVVNAIAGFRVKRRDGTDPAVGDIIGGANPVPLVGICQLISGTPTFLCLSPLPSEFASTAALGTIKVPNNFKSVTSSTRTTITGSGTNVYTSGLSGTFTKKSATSDLIVLITNPLYYASSGPTTLRLTVGGSAKYGLTAPATPGQSYGQTAINGQFSSIAAGSVSWALDYARGDSNAWTLTINPSSSDQAYYPPSSTTTLMFFEVEP